MSTLYLDCHSIKNCFILFENQIYEMSDIAKEIDEVFKKFQNITKIIVTRGPGSFTSLRIGMTFALAYAISKNIPLLGISVFTLLNEEFPKHTIYFFTGTKKWIKKTKSTKKIIENNFKDNKPWLSNKPEMLNLTKNQTPYPSIVKLMQKFDNLANKNLNLIYSITMF